MMGPGWRPCLLVVVLCLAPALALADGSAERIELNQVLGDSGGGDSFSKVVAELADAAGASSAPFEQAGSILEAWSAWRDYNEALSDLDRELDGSLGSGGEGGPEVPSSCAMRSGCHDCFERAYREVTFSRITLARLKAIHTRTIRYIERSESFGDTVSPIHGLSGLAWQGAKADIERERVKFNRTSRQKYEQLVGNMRRGLGMVDTCEREHFDNPDWFKRYGFMYLEFVQSAYAPGDD